MLSHLNGHLPDWYTRRCYTCRGSWPCLVARVFLRLAFLDAAGALYGYLRELEEAALTVRDDDADQLQAQLVEWAFMTGVRRRRVVSRSI